MTDNYTPQISASDRYAAARILLTAWDEAAQPDASGCHDASGFAMRESERIRLILRALITPPGVHESEEQIAKRISDEVWEESQDDASPFFTPGKVGREIGRRAVRAGIQAAHETWEPEVALRPTQEQMLRWLGIETAIDHSVGMLYVREQYIDREDD